MRSVLSSFLIAFVGFARPVVAQAVKTPADSVFEHARQLVLNGKSAAGRVIVDSMVAAATPDTPEYGDALYWRAALAAASEDAERDFRRVVVEYPLSRHAGDALLQLSQLEVARGDRKAAQTHLERFILENTRNPERTRGGLLLVKTAFEQNDPRTGCLFLRRLLGEIPETSVEVRNQFTYYSPRCVNVDTMAVRQAPDTTIARADTAAKAAPAKGRYTLQVAAYPTRADADRLVKRLADRGVDARVVGTSKLFRVRIGYYETRAAATAAAKDLKARKIDTIVATVGPDDK